MYGHLLHCQSKDTEVNKFVLLRKVEEVTEVKKLLMYGPQNRFNQGILSIIHTTRKLESIEVWAIVRIIVWSYKKESSCLSF